MRRFPAPMVLAAVVIAALTACAPVAGSGAGPGTAGPGTAGPGTTAPVTAATTNSVAPGSGSGNADLTVSLKQAADATPVVYALICADGAPAPGSDLPTAAQACAALRKSPQLLAQTTPPAGQLCTEQYGGPQQAVVSGTVDGTAVRASYSLRNGCEISAWNAVKDIVGAAGGAS
ncbi:hypothetical protein AL755_18485 [Arthrobacter sp. ERGS1:01]|uniref:SSI family serine proteinase inhibitor n=1 Tax=Arthrobacter sp. ERGS1:01 TaxID=1704044 RepID=UPI0006CB1C4F|nr:SSI family serine proteinase inhibitor [Arthrobacter sp. ERGS1:01]ALE06983.1 hypothetical protein AL755_18485 [Arthrobacter sp. ERGS1:01]